MYVADDDDVPEIRRYRKMGNCTHTEKTKAGYKKDVF